MRVQADRILIVKLGAIGDVVNSLPLVNRLRAGYPGARISWVIARKALRAVAGHAAVDEFIEFDATRAATWPTFVRELRARRFDLALDLQRILKSGLITRASGAHTRLGFDRARCKEASHWFTNARIPANSRPGVTVEQYLEFADFLELPPSPPRFELPYEDVEPRADGELRVVVNVGATKSANRWSSAQWAALCRRLVLELGARVYLSGGEIDRAEVAAVAEAAQVPLADRAGRMSLKQTAGLIRSAQLFIGCDTGPLHIAAALGTPLVALFGASDPERTGPFGQAAWIASNPAPCSPCRRRDCNVAGHPCMSLLEVERVFALARRRLQASGTAAGKGHELAL